MTETPPCPACGAPTVGIVHTATPDLQLGPPLALYCRGPEPHRIIVEPLEHESD